MGQPGMGLRGKGALARLCGPAGDGSSYGEGHPEVGQWEGCVRRGDSDEVGKRCVFTGDHRVLSTKLAIPR